MAICTNCGAQVEGNFCPKCGSPRVDGTVPPPQPSYQPASAGITENVASALCYLLGFITGIIFLVVDPYKNNRQIRFHAFQSIFLSIAWIVLWTVVSIVLPWAIYFVVTPLISLAGLGLWLYLMWKTYQNQKVVLPVVGEMAQKQA